MLHEEDGYPAFPDTADQLGDVGGFSSVKTRCRLIQHKEPGFSCKGTCDLQDPLATEGQTAGLHSRVIGKSCELEDLHGGVPDPFLFPPNPWKLEGRSDETTL